MPTKGKKLNDVHFFILICCKNKKNIWITQSLASPSHPRHGVPRHAAKAFVYSHENVRLSLPHWLCKHNYQSRIRVNAVSTESIFLHNYDTLSSFSKKRILFFNKLVFNLLNKIWWTILLFIVTNSGAGFDSAMGYQRVVTQRVTTLFLSPPRWHSRP